MARRALTTWMHRQQELTRLLSVRHAMLVRPEPGLRVLQALGLAPDDAALDGRPRRLVRAVRVLDQRPAVHVVDDELSADHESSPAATLHPSPARPTETAPVDMAAEGAHEFNAQSDRSADEPREVEAERIALSTPEQVPSPVVEYAAASVTQAAPAPEH